MQLERPIKTLKYEKQDKTRQEETRWDETKKDETRQDENKKGRKNNSLHKASKNLRHFYIGHDSRWLDILYETCADGVYVHNT